MTDASGTVVWAADYKPFGEATITVSTITNNLRFPGQYFDAETGLLYNMHRTYNKDLGRYIEADPIGIQKGRNHLYIYVSNNPTNRTDPSGLSERDVIRIVTEAASFTRYLTDTGQRRDPGVINNLLITCRTLGLTDNEYNGCGGQADALLAHLNDWQRSAGLDDRWTFERVFRPIHFYVKARSSRRCDQELTLDPWRNYYRGD